MDYIDTILQGDALTSLQTIPDGVVQCCVTSPPYYSLRDYQIEGQIGLEETPQEYVEKLVQVFREVKRVLRNDGTLWLNLGSSYSCGIIESEEYIMRDDLTQEEIAHVYTELAQHFTQQSQAMSTVREIDASPE